MEHDDDLTAAERKFTAPPHGRSGRDGGKSD